MAEINRNVSDTVPRCFKHNPTWQSRVQHLLNKIRDSLIPKIYLGRFNSLLCTCGKGFVSQRPDIASAWDEVSESELAHAVTFIDNFITQNIGNANVPVLKKIMDNLRKDKEINEESSVAPQPASRSSALKLLYLLQKVIEKNYSILQPRKPTPSDKQPKKEKHEQSLTIILEDYKPELIGQLIGAAGQNIMIFMKREKCHVRCEKVEIDGREKVKATLKKTVEDMAVLERIAEELKQFAKDTQDTVESYRPSDEEEDMEDVENTTNEVTNEASQLTEDELKEEYRKLVEQAMAKGKIETFNCIAEYYRQNPNSRYDAVTDNFYVLQQVPVYNEVLNRLPPKSPASSISSLTIEQGRNAENTAQQAISSNNTSASSVSRDNSGQGEPKAKIQKTF